MSLYRLQFLPRKETKAIGFLRSQILNNQKNKQQRTEFVGAILQRRNLTESHDERLSGILAKEAEALRKKRQQGASNFMSHQKQTKESLSQQLSRKIEEHHEKKEEDRKQLKREQYYEDVDEYREAYAEVKKRVMEKKKNQKEIPEEEQNELNELQNTDPDIVTVEAQYFEQEANLPLGLEAEMGGVYTQNKSKKIPSESDWIFTLTEDNYNELVEEEKIPVIIDCWAPQIADSLAVSSTLQIFVEAINQNGLKFKLLQLDTNLNYGLAMHLEISSLPTTLAVKDSHVLESISGLIDEEAMAQFVFGYAQAVYGDKALQHLTEDTLICQLVDARVALKEKDYTESTRLYRLVYSKANEQKIKEEEERKQQHKEGNYIPEASRPLSTAEIIAAKAISGIMLNTYYQRRYRAARNVMKTIKTEHQKAYRTLSDIRKSVSTVEIMILTQFRPDLDVEDLEDEERIDQHNLDIKLKLIGVYFMSGDFKKALSSCFILIRKNRKYKGEVGTLVMMRIMMYLGRHHPLREVYHDTFLQLLRIPLARTTTINQKVRLALNEPLGQGVLEHEIPIMIDNFQYAAEKEGARHPLLR